MLILDQLIGYKMRISILKVQVTVSTKCRHSVSGTHHVTQLNKKHEFVFIIIEGI